MKYIPFGLLLFVCFINAAERKFEKILRSRTPDLQLLHSGKVTVGGHIPIKGFNVESPDGSIHVAQVIVANQEEEKTITNADGSTIRQGGGACGPHALYNSLTLINDITTRGRETNLAIQLLGKKGIKNTIGSYDTPHNTLRYYANELFQNNGEWLDDVQMNTLMTELIKGKQVEEKEVNWPQTVPFATFDIQTSSLLATIGNLDRVQPLGFTPEIDQSFTAIKTLRKAIQEKTPVAACFCLNTAQKESQSGHWITTTVHTNDKGQLQFTVADSHNEIRIFNDPILKQLIGLITDKDDVLYCPTNIQQSEIQNFEKIINKALQTKSLDQNLSAALTNSFERISRWLGDQSIPEKLFQKYHEAMDKLYS